MKQGRRNTPHKSQRKMSSPTIEQEFAKILRKFHDFRQSNQFCDGVLVSGDGKEYKIHRILMASNSDYFRAAFGSPLSSNATLVKLDFPSDVVDELVEFCYTQSCSITDRNVQQLLAAADQIGIIGLVDSCCEFLAENINLNNAYGIYRFASIYSCYSLVQSAWKFLLSEFGTFIEQSKEFQEMTVDDLELLLKTSSLNVLSEEVVFQAICQWVDVKPAEREHLANRLWPCVRFGLLGPEYYRVNVMSAPFIRSISSGNLWDALASVKGLAGPKEMSLPRVPHQIVFAIGGWTAGTPTNSLETYDIRADRWFTSNEYDMVPRAYHGVVSVDNMIYVIGGFNGANHFSSVRCYDPVKKIWTEKACMHRLRCYVSCVVVNEDIYAIGGYDSVDRMSSVERYSVAENQWHFVRPMFRRRSDCGAVTVGSKIYVAGGFNGQDVLDSAEYYDTETNTWHTLPNLNTRRSGVCLVYFRGYIYALGGFNGGARLNTVERLDVSRPNEWNMDVPNMITQRSNFAGLVLEDKIYVMGGFNGMSTIQYCECFDGDEWREIASMNGNRSALSVCVCKNLENAEEYTNTRLGIAQPKSAAT